MKKGVPPLYAISSKKSGGFIAYRDSKQSCPICEKIGHLCGISHDGSANICYRVESDNRTAGGGYVHRNADYESLANISLSLIDNPKPVIEKMSPQEAASRQFNHLLQIEDIDYQMLSEAQGVSIETLKSFGVGVDFHFDSGSENYTFPQRTMGGEICGFRTMSKDGERTKMSIRGSKAGGFLVPEFITREYIDLSSYLLVCEGFTDAQIAFDLGFKSVIGRSNCVGELNELVDLIESIYPLDLLVVPDADTAGISGADELIAQVRRVMGKKVRVSSVDLGEGFDVRDYCEDESGKTDFINFLQGLVRFNDDEQWDKQIKAREEEKTAAQIEEYRKYRCRIEAKERGREEAARRDESCRQKARPLLGGESAIAESVTD